MILWINWVLAALLGMLPIYLHLLRKRPKSETVTYDLAGMITDPPSSELENPARSFAKIRQIDDVELSVQAIRDCLLRSRELSRPHKRKVATGIALEKSATAIADRSAEDVLHELSTVVGKPTEPPVPEVVNELENDNDTRPIVTTPVQQRTTNTARNNGNRHIGNIDAALEIRSRKS